MFVGGIGDKRVQPFARYLPIEVAAKAAHVRFTACAFLYRYPSTAVDVKKAVVSSKAYCLYPGPASIVQLKTGSG